MTNNSLLKFILLFFLTIGIFLAINNIWLPYSYWWDELFSVTASSLSMNEMFSKFIMNDVHPPLYQIVLKLWIDFFSASEFSTRSLSLIFSLSSITIFSMWAYKKLPLRISAAAIAVFSTSFLFSFYAQETRSYAMMLFLSTLLTIVAIRFFTGENSIKSSVLVAFLALILSLTHFFGLLYAGLVLLYLVITTENNKCRVVFFFSGLITLIWPITHFLFGGLSSKTGGDFWIKSNGIQTTLEIFFHAFVPQISILNKLLPSYIITLLAIFSLFFLTFFVYKKLKGKANDLEGKVFNVFIFVSSVVFSFIIIIAIIDLHTPISTARNFTVLLPAFSVFISYLFLYFSRFNVFYLAIVALFSFSSVGFSYLKLNEKQFPRQNHFLASEYIVENKLHETHHFYYRESAESGMPEIQNMMARFYIDKISDIEFEAVPIDPKDLISLEKSKPFIYFSQHTKTDVEDLIKKLEDVGFNVVYFEPQQNSKSSSFVIHTVN